MRLLPARVKHWFPGTFQDVPRVRQDAARSLRESAHLFRERTLRVFIGEFFLHCWA